MAITNPDGQLAVAHPPPGHPFAPLAKLLILHAVVPVFLPVLLVRKLLTQKNFRSTLSDVYSLVSGATADPEPEKWYFRDPALLRHMWKLPSARAYVENLEYQMSEGYCGSATARCVLRSLGFSAGELPEQKRGESKPETWCEGIKKMAEEAKTRRSRIGNNDGENDDGDNLKINEVETAIIRGDVPYEEFLSRLRGGLADEDCRVGCNFLRSALTGFGGTRYIPANFVLSVFAGHFSPILGILEGKEVVSEDNNASIRRRGNVDWDEKKGEKEGEGDDNPLVAIWDTNHKYGGAYLVPARRLHAAVGAVDISANESRAIVLVYGRRE